MIVSVPAGVTNFWTGFRVPKAVSAKVSAKGRLVWGARLHGGCAWPGSAPRGEIQAAEKTENAPSGGAGRSLEHRPATKWLRFILKLPPNKTRGP